MYFNYTMRSAEFQLYFMEESLFGCAVFLHGNMFAGVLESLDFKTASVAQLVLKRLTQMCSWKSEKS